MIFVYWICVGIAIGIGFMLAPHAVSLVLAALGLVLRSVVALVYFWWRAAQHNAWWGLAGVVAILVVGVWFEGFRERSDRRYAEAKKQLAEAEKRIAETEKRIAEAKEWS